MIARGLASPVFLIELDAIAAMVERADNMLGAASPNLQYLVDAPRIPSTMSGAVEVGGPHKPALADGTGCRR